MFFCDKTALLPSSQRSSGRQAHLLSDTPRQGCFLRHTEAYINSCTRVGVQRDGLGDKLSDLRLGRLPRQAAVAYARRTALLRSPMAALTSA